MGTRRWSFEEPPRRAPEGSAWRFTMGLLIGLALCGAAFVQFLP